MKKGFLFKKVKPIALDSEKIEKLIEKIEERGELTQEGRESMPEVLRHVNVMFRKFKVLGQLFMLRADTIRVTKGFDEELDSIEAYLKGDNSPENDGKISDVKSDDMTEKITMALLDLYLSPFNFSQEEIEEYTNSMRMAMAHKGV